MHAYTPACPALRPTTSAYPVLPSRQAVENHVFACIGRRHSGVYRQLHLVVHHALQEHSKLPNRGRVGGCGPLQPRLVDAHSCLALLGGVQGDGKVKRRAWKRQGQGQKERCCMLLRNHHTMHYAFGQSTPSCLTLPPVRVGAATRCGSPTSSTAVLAEAGPKPTAFPCSRTAEREGYDQSTWQLNSWACLFMRTHHSSSRSPAPPTAATCRAAEWAGQRWNRYAQPRRKHWSLRPAVSGVG